MLAPRASVRTGSSLPWQRLPDEDLWGPAWWPVLPAACSLI